nr:AAA family ATPase [Methylacidimicrobium sp. AP8]
MDLLPAFCDLCDQDSKKVYLIDEVDRSLHTLLLRRLLEAYLAGCSPRSRRQLLFTTHDVLLMDQELLRRDEMWVTERDAGGVSRLFWFSDYKGVRYDKDIRKSYLQGRLGGIPRIVVQGALSSSYGSEARG